MPYDRRKFMIIFFQLFDLVLMCASFLLATWVVSDLQAPNMSFHAFLEMRIKVQNFLIFLGMLFIWNRIFASFGLYNSKRLSTNLDEILEIIKASLLGTLAFFVIGIFFHIVLITPVSIGVFGSAVCALTILSRLLGRFALKRMRIKGRNLRFMLIVGTNSRAISFVKKIAKNPQLGYKIIGFVDDHWGGLGEFKKSGYSVVTSLDDLPGFLRDNIVDEIAIALPVKSSYEQIDKIVRLCERHGIITRFLSDMFNQKIARSKSERFEDINVITHTTGSLRGWPVLIKYAIDFCVSLITLIILSPLFLMVGLAIKLTSPGPIFFIQERVGLNKRRFRLYKFRTMVPDAEKLITQLEHLNEVDGPAFKIKHDPRITPFGKFLRKTSLDELPQLINVLRGDMSLVGPRPLPLRDYKGFSEDWQRRRFSARPGITCLWQVNGRCNVDFENWMKLDMEYIDNWTLWLDLKILGKTIPAVLKGSGAA
jgi:exopolysaccharide biosynthesis polyprenyl glycosylphosphotransferase